MTNDSTSTTIAKSWVLFVCAGNTCRSVLAEYIARRKFGQLIEPSSAGLRPGTIEHADNAIYTLKTLMAVDASAHVPRDVRTVEIERADLVVAMSSQIAAEVRHLFPNLPAERLVRWKIKDPYGTDLAEYQRCAQSIYAEMKRLPLLAGKA